MATMWAMRPSGSSHRNCSGRSAQLTRAAGWAATSLASRCRKRMSATPAMLRPACAIRSSTSTTRSFRCPWSSASASAHGGPAWTGRRCTKAPTRTSTSTSAAGGRPARSLGPESRVAVPAGPVLPASFFDRDTPVVARELLGKVLVREMNGRKLWGRLVEVEAYMGPEDLASHSYGGRRSPRNEVMYGGPGHAYVYFTYGMHFCL